MLKEYDQESILYDKYMNTLKIQKKQAVANVARQRHNKNYNINYSE